MIRHASFSEWVTIEQYDILNDQIIQLDREFRKQIVRKIQPFQIAHFTDRCRDFIQSVVRQKQVLSLIHI